jgi:oligosaccharide repeat unit polymerase
LKIPIIVFFWLLFWLIAANIPIGGIYAISMKANVIVFIGLIGFLLGCILALSIKNVKENLNFFSKYENKVLSFFNFFMPLSLVIIILLLIKFIWIVIYDPLAISRLALFGTDEEPSIIFGSQQALLIYTIFFKTIIKILVLFGFLLSIKKNNIKYLLTANLIWLMDSILFLGRGALLEFIFQIIFYFIICKILKISISSKVKKISVFLTVLFLFLAPTMSMLRGDEEKVDIKSFLYSQVVNYHTVGYVIFDLELQKSNSRLNSNITFGRASLGGIERLIVLFIRRFDKSIDSISGQNGEYLNEFRLLGKNMYGEELYYNAFATLFFTFYLDGGLVFVFVGFLIFAFFLTRSALLVALNRLEYLPILYLLFQFGLNSLYGSPVENTIFWYVVVILYIIRRVNFLKFKIKFL